MVEGGTRLVWEGMRERGGPTGCWVRPGREGGGARGCWRHPLAAAVQLASTEIGCCLATPAVGVTGPLCCVLAVPGQERLAEARGSAAGGLTTPTLTGDLATPTCSLPPLASGGAIDRGAGRWTVGDC